MSSSQGNNNSNHRRMQRPSSGVIRKRPISFGNPALGTYHGKVYTLEDFSTPPSSSNRPLVEGAETVERMAAMVDVPPEQVPEGVLNLARSHRKFIVQVRIVIAEQSASIEHQEQQLQRDSKHSTSRTQQQEELLTSFSNLSCHEGGETVDLRKSAPPLSSLSSPSTSVYESAASILAADEELESQKLRGKQQQQQQEQLEECQRQNVAQQMLWSSLEDGGESRNTDRTYVVLVELCSEEATTNFVQDLHGKPFTILDEDVTCSVHHVIALQGEDGVSLMSPFFAPSTQKILHSNSDNEEETATSSSPKNNANSNANNTPSPHLTVDHNCAVCLEHMVLDHRTILGNEGTSILTTVCNHTFHLDCIVRWQDSPCPVCRYDHSGLNEALSQCHLCGTTEHNYVCLICGVVSCAGGGGGASSGAGPSRAGRSEGMDDTCGSISQSSGLDNSEGSHLQRRLVSSSHARRHYDETLHAYALDTETQHVWDFAGQGYVHRLLQNKDDGKLVEISDPNNTTSQERSVNPGLSEAQEGEVVHRKLEGFASQYYTLLKSQLEQQRIFYEGRLEELRREYIDQTTPSKPKKSKSQDLIAALRQEKKQLTQRYESLERRHEKVMDDVVFLKNMNESLESNKALLKRKIADAQRQRIESNDMFQMYLPALESKLSALMLQLEGESCTTNTSTAEKKECAPTSAAADGDDGCKKPSSTTK